MIIALIGYGLLVMYTIGCIVFSAICWLMMGIGIAIYRGEDHTVDADWRGPAVALVVIGALLQWLTLKAADTVITGLWHSLPSFPFS